MSSTTLYRFPAAGPGDYYREFRNAHRGAMSVWLTLVRKYLGPDASVFNDEVAEKLWALADNPLLTRAERLALLTTFDCYLVRREDMVDLADCLDEFARSVSSPTHLPEQAAALRELAADPTCAAAGWRQTSVAENLWWIVTGEDEGRMYDLSRDTGYYFTHDHPAVKSPPAAETALR